MSIETRPWTARASGGSGVGGAAVGRDVSAPNRVGPDFYRWSYRIHQTADRA